MTDTTKTGQSQKANLFSDRAKERLKKKFFSHPLFPKIKRLYPYRDYDYQLELLWDWWKAKKRKPPTAISAFTNWLKNTQIDGDIKHEVEREWNMQKNPAYEDNRGKPINEEGLKKLQAMKDKILK